MLASAAQTATLQSGFENLKVILTYNACWDILFPRKKRVYRHFCIKDKVTIAMMRVSYNKLWKLMIDRKLMKKDLTAMAGISTNAMAKMGKEENVSTEVLGKICDALQCRIEEIIEFLPYEEPSPKNRTDTVL